MNRRSFLGTLASVAAVCIPWPLRKLRRRPVVICRADRANTNGRIYTADALKRAVVNSPREIPLVGLRQEFLGTCSGLRMAGDALVVDITLADGMTARTVGVGHNVLHSADGLMEIRDFELSAVQAMPIEQAARL